MSIEYPDTINPEYISNPFVQKELYDLIDKVYFTNFAKLEIHEERNIKYNDTVDFELKNIDYENNDPKVNVKNLIKKLQIQHEIVGRKLSDIILQNSQSYSIELKRVSDFKQILEDSYQICRISRRSLGITLDSYVYSQLKLLNRQNKRLHLIRLLENVEKIKNLTLNTNNIIHLIGTRDYLQALNFCIKIENSLEKYDFLKCIKSLKKTIKECYKLIEDNSSMDLLKICRKYDECLFANICMSNQKMNNFNAFLEKLNENFKNTIKNVSLQTLIRIIVSRRFPIEENETENENLSGQIESFISELRQKNFTNDLFSLVVFDDYEISLKELCSNLWQIMKNFYSMSIWMHNNFNHSMSENFAKMTANIQCKIWDEVQNNVSIYFKSMNLENFKFDDYLEILTILSRFIELGNEFCNKTSECDIIIQAVKEQTLAYINYYHLSHLEELKMFLENEIWECCPVKSDFSVFNLQEYKFLKSNVEQNASESTLELIEKNITLDSERSKPTKFEINDNMIQLINFSNEKKNKFNIFDDIDILKKNKTKDSSNSQISHIDDDCKSINFTKDLSLIIDVNQEQPILTNTTLNIIRLFDFTQTSEIPTDQNERSNLNIVEKNSTLNLIFKNIKNDIFNNTKISIPRMKKTKLIQNYEEYILLTKQRIIAAESLIYLSKQLENLFPLIKKILPAKQIKENEINNLDAYTNILRETPKIRRTIYSFIANNSIDYNQLIDSISKVNWDLNEIFSQHNSYIDVLLQQLKDLKTNLQNLDSKIPLNRKIVNSILEETLRLCMKILVDGYSSVKKCSNEGRALMQLDFQQLVVKLEEEFDIRPIPEKDFVETFIKAYYLPDSSIEKWVKEHQEYQPKHVISLVGIMGQISKKTRSTILNTLNNNLQIQYGSNA